MKQIVERCPACGVEHDREVHECEACGSPVRYWCRTHSRDIGWLEAAECRRCAEEAARPAAPRTRAAPPATRRPAAPAPRPAPARAPRRRAPAPRRHRPPATPIRGRPQTVTRNVIFILLAAGVGGGLLALGERQPKEVYAIAVALVVAGLTGGMLLLFTSMFRDPRDRDR